MGDTHEVLLVHPVARIQVVEQSQLMKQLADAKMTLKSKTYVVRLAVLRGQQILVVVRQGSHRAQEGSRQIHLVVVVVPPHRQQDPGVRQGGLVQPVC